MWRMDLKRAEGKQEDELGSLEQGDGSGDAEIEVGALGMCFVDRSNQKDLLPD